MHQATMSHVFCPNASRTLLRAAARAWTSCPSTTTSRVFSQSAAPIRSIPHFCSTSKSILRQKSLIVAATLAQRRTFFRDTIIRDYVDLPRDYKDRIGLPFTRKDLTEEQVDEIFGKDAPTAASANHLLRILHGRRVAGTLDDPAFAVHTMQYSEEHMAKGLEYLREKVRLDEVMNAGFRAEDELGQMELDSEGDEPQKTTNAKTSTDETSTEEKSAEEVEVKPDPVYGRSSFDEIRARNQAKAKAREEALEAERQARLEAMGEEAQNQTRSLVEVEEGQRAITNPKIAEYYKNASSGLDEIPQLTFWERVWPSAGFYFLVVGFMGSLAMVYSEPDERHRLFPEVSTAVATVGAIVALNVAVYFAWKAPPLWRLMNKYMIFVVGMPKPVTLFTCIFSHQDFTKHMALNMAALALSGTFLHEDIGRMSFLTLFLGCGGAGALTGLVVYSAKGMLHISSMGASGAVFGILGAFFWDHRDDRFRIWGLPQDGVHGVVWLAMLTGVLLSEAVSGLKRRVDVVSHVAGLAAGMLGIEVLNAVGLGRKRDDGKGKEKGEKVVVKDLALKEDVKDEAKVKEVKA